MTWTIRGTMASGTAETAAGLKLIQDKTGQFVAYSSPDHARLIAAAEGMRDTLAIIARLKMDGENGFDLTNDDAVDSLHACIDLARSTLAEIEGAV